MIHEILTGRIVPGMMFHNTDEGSQGGSNPPQQPSGQDVAQSAQQTANLAQQHVQVEQGQQQGQTTPQGSTPIPGAPGAQQQAQPTPPPQPPPQQVPQPQPSPQPSNSGAATSSAPVASAVSQAGEAISGAVKEVGWKIKWGGKTVATVPLGILAIILICVGVLSGYFINEKISIRNPIVTEDNKPKTPHSVVVNNAPVDRKNLVFGNIGWWKSRAVRHDDALRGEYTIQCDNGQIVYQRLIRPVDDGTAIEIYDLNKADGKYYLKGPAIPAVPQPVNPTQVPATAAQQ